MGDRTAVTVAAERLPAGRGCRAPAKLAGFTLMEILVVVVIGLIAASVALPSFVRAMQGQRIRSSARLVVTSHKFARNMSVLRQTPMAVLFNRVENKIDVVAISGMEQMALRDRFLEQQAQAAANGPLDAGGEDEKDSPADDEDI